MDKELLLKNYSTAMVLFNKAKGALQEYIFDKIRSGDNPMEDNNEHTETLVAPMFINVGGWACEGSPINICCYNNYTDRAQDFCIFCGHPDERK